MEYTWPARLAIAKVLKIDRISVQFIRGLPDWWEIRNRAWRNYSMSGMFQNDIHEGDLCTIQWNPEDSNKFNL